MSLRLRLFVGLSLGAVVFLSGTAWMRGRLEREQLEIGANTSAELTGESVALEVTRVQEEIGRRLGRWTRAATAGVVAQYTDEERSPRRFWSRLRATAELLPSETLALVDASGTLLAADGAWANATEAFDDMLKERALCAQGAEEATRSGMLAGGVRPVMGVSQGVPPEATWIGTEASDIPGYGFRAVLVRNLLLDTLGSRASETSVELLDLAKDDIPDSATGASLSDLRGGGVFSLQDEGARVNARTMHDPANRPSFLLFSRAQINGGSMLPAHVRESLVWEALAAAFVILLAMRMVSKRVQQPLENLEQQARRMARSEHGSLAFHSAEWGVFAELASALDEMLVKIKEDRSEYVRSARIAGMSDVSMAVVHNAGNVLNSINVSTQYVAREISGLGVTDMRSMVAELEEHKDDLATYVTDDPNGKFMIPFLAAMTEALEDLRTRCLVELESMDNGIEHVVDLIRSQERYAIGASVIEEARIPDILNMALNIAALSNTQSNLIQVDRSYAKLAAVRIDRHKLTSILINVISNAIEALVPEEVERRHLELSVYSMSKDRFVIEITDTGVGIAPENLDRIFNSNFTTKSSSSGHGLHTTANLCNEMGIAIGAVSEGPGCGTTIKLRVPYEPPCSEVEGDVDSPAAALPVEGMVAVAPVDQVDQVGRDRVA